MDPETELLFLNYGDQPLCGLSTGIPSKVRSQYLVC